MPISQPILDSLVALIREEGSSLWSSKEDADYFRSSFKKGTAKQREPEQPPSIAICPSVLATPFPIEPKIEVPQKKIEEEPVFIKPTLPSSMMRNIFSMTLPKVAVLDDIPNDEIARKLSTRWKTKNQTAPISILVYQEPPEQRALLEQIARAVDTYFGPAKTVQAEEIEKEKQWQAFLSVEGLKMVIVCDYTLWQLSALMSFYKETPNQGTRVLGAIPLFLLPDLSLYLKDALLKRSLWKALCQKCM